MIETLRRLDLEIFLNSLTPPPLTSTKYDPFGLSSDADDPTLIGIPNASTLTCETQFSPCAMQNLLPPAWPLSVRSFQCSHRCALYMTPPLDSPSMSLCPSQPSLTTHPQANGVLTPPASFDPGSASASAIPTLLVSQSCSR